MKTEVPDPAPRPEFVFHNMPRWTEGGVYLLLHRALADSIRLTYNRNDLTARRADEAPLAGPNRSFDLYWVGDWRERNRPLIIREAGHEAH